MMKIKKGQYGYRTSMHRMRLCMTSVLAAAVLLQLLARNWTQQQAARNILTVMAILTVLPMANMAAPLIASWRYKTAPQAFYQRVKTYEPQTMLLYDLIVTTKEQVIPLDAVAVHPQGVFAYCSQPRINIDQAEKALQTLFSANRLQYRIRLFCDERSFFRRLDSLKPSSEWEDDGSLALAASLISSQSM